MENDVFLIRDVDILIWKSAGKDNKYFWTHKISSNVLLDTTQTKGGMQGGQHDKNKGRTSRQSLLYSLVQMSFPWLSCDSPCRGTWLPYINVFMMKGLYATAERFNQIIINHWISANRCFAVNWLCTIDECMPWDMPEGVTNVMTTPLFIPVTSINRFLLFLSFSS